MAKTIKWVPVRGERPTGTNTTYYGSGVLPDGGVKSSSGVACFAVWQNHIFSKITYQPRLHKIEWCPQAETIMRYAHNKVFRKIFPIIPQFHILRRGDAGVSVDIGDGRKQWTYKEANLAFRVLRSFQEQPSIPASCYYLHKLHPDLEAPWLLGLAATGLWDTEGNVGSHVTYHHQTFNSNMGFALARAFSHCMEHKGKLFGGGVYDALPSKHQYPYSYRGLSDLAEDKLFPVQYPSKGLYTVDTNYTTNYSAAAIVAVMREVRRQHQEGNRDLIKVGTDAIAELLPKANEGLDRQRIW